MENQEKSIQNQKLYLPLDILNKPIDQKDIFLNRRFNGLKSIKQSNLHTSTNSSQDFKVTYASTHRDRANQNMNNKLGITQTPENKKSLSMNFNNNNNDNNSLQLDQLKNKANAGSSLDEDQIRELKIKVELKDREIESLKQQMTDRKFNNSSYNFNKSGSNLLDVSLQNPDKEELTSLKQTLQSLIDREQEVFFQLKQRCDKLQDILDLFSFPESFNFESTKDFVRFKEAVKELSSTLIGAAKNEIDLGAKIRESEKAKIEVSQAKQKCSILTEKNTELLKIIDLLQTRNKMLQEDNNNLMRLLNIEKRNSNTNAKKVGQLEKRVEFILETDVNMNLNPNDKLRSSLNELLRENESLKRDLAHKNQEIERLHGTVKRLNAFITRLNKKIESFKKNPQNFQQELQGGSKGVMPGATGGGGGGGMIGGGGGGAPSTTDEMSKFYKKDDIDLLSNYAIPSNLDFKIISLKSEFINIISDVMEAGAGSFAQHVIKKKNNEDEMLEMIQLVASQFLQYKDIAEKLNWIALQIYNIFRSRDLPQIIADINKSFPFVYNAQRLNLWIVDSMTGSLYSYFERQEKRCLMNKGIMGEVFYYKQALNVKNAKAKALLYRISSDYAKEEPESVDATLLLPVFSNSGYKIRAVVEVSNSNHELFSFEEEYLGIVFARFLGLYLQQYTDIEVSIIDLKYKNIIFSAFENLMTATSKYEFTKLVKNQIKGVFGVQNCVFYYVEGNKLQLYNEDNNNKNVPTKSFGFEYGLAGYVAKNGASFIVTDVKRSSYYNQLVDIDSVLPIQAIPIVQKVDYQTENICIGVIELVLKNKFASKLEKDKLIDPEEGLLGPDEPLANVLINFTSMVTIAMRNLNFTAQQQFNIK